MAKRAEFTPFEKGNSVEDFLDWATRKLIADYDRKRNRARNKAYWAKMIITLLGVASTLVIGVGNSSVLNAANGPAIASMVALFFTSAIAFISTWSAYAGHEWKWVQYRAVLAALYELRDDLMIATAGKTALTKEEGRKLYFKLKAVLRESNATWAERRASLLAQSQHAASETKPHPKSKGGKTSRNARPPRPKKPE